MKRFMAFETLEMSLFIFVLSLGSLKVWTLVTVAQLVGSRGSIP